MRAIAVAALDGLVRNEPRVAAASDPAAGTAPARDVRRVLILDAQRQPVERRLRPVRKVEDELLAVVEKAVGVDRLVMPDGRGRRSVPTARRPRPPRWLIDLIQ